MMKLSELIKNRREALGMTREEVAAASGIAKSHMWSIENKNSSGIKLITAIRLSISLGIHINLLAAAYMESYEEKVKIDEIVGEGNE